jgi:hypothetical protein
MMQQCTDSDSESSKVVRYGRVMCGRVGLDYAGQDRAGQ